MRAPWLTEALYLAALLVPMLILAALFGGLAWWLMLAVLIVLARQLYQLDRLERWLRAGRLRNPPQSWGIWGEVFEHYYRLQRRYYKRKKRLAKVIRRYRESTEAMPDGTVVLDAEWRILWFNEAAVQLLKLASNRDLGQHVTNLLRHPAFDAYIRRGDFTQAVELPSPAAGHRTLSIRIVPYGDRQLLLLAQDITRLQRLQAMRRDFVANASHELRSPLTVLAGYLESLADDELAPPDWRAPLVEMQGQCRRMTSLINDLLELSRLETEAPDAPVDSVVPIPTMINHILEDARAQDRGQRRIEVNIDTTLALAGVEGELHSAFANLVLNAMRYSDADGRIQIRWQRNEEGGAAFEVEDEGIGIDPRHLPFITQRFYRVDPSRNRDQGGTGLGLAIVKHVLQRHSGKLEIDSVPGEGSCFRCVFTADRLRPAVAAIQSEQSEQSEQRPVTKTS